MATTPLSNFQTQEPNTTHIGSNPPRVLGANSSSAQRGRKPNGRKNQPKKKKIPQRGMGVAQLEMLRLQESRWKAQVDNSFVTLNPNFTQPHQVMTTTSFNPQQSTPFEYYCNGLNLFGSGDVVGACAGPYGRNVFETSRELSSIPKMVMYPFPRQHFEANDHNLSCDICFKKMWNGGEKQGHFGRRDSLGQTLPYQGRDFLGINQENNPYFNAQMGGFSARAARSAFYANHNSNEGLEGVPINIWKGNSLMEHEFFPGKNGGGTNPKQMELGPEASVAVGGEAKSCLTTSDHSGSSASNTSSYVDLSLKL